MDDDGTSHCWLATLATITVVPERQQFKVSFARDGCGMLILLAMLLLRALTLLVLLVCCCRRLKNVAISSFLFLVAILLCVITT